MSKLHVLVVVGTRPEAIKLAPVIGELRRHAGATTTVCSTGQHRQMLDQVFELFKMSPDIELALMSPEQSLDVLTGLVVREMSRLLLETHPHLLLVQGDTTTAMAASLAAFYQKIPVGHVEAGLRTRRRYSPFPEEMNRRLITQLATLHFAPTVRAVQNLQKENLADMSRVVMTGNPIVDSVLAVGDLVRGRPLPYSRDAQRMVLLTAHRRENFGKPLERICDAIIALTSRNPDLEVVYPVHLNPAVKRIVDARLAGRQRIHLLPPLDYGDFITTLIASDVAVTDSGGVQEEAPVFGKPTLVLRDDTERPEGIDSGNARLIGTETASIVRAVEELLHDRQAYVSMARRANPYGDGHAASRIVGAIFDWWADVDH